MYLSVFTDELFKDVYEALPIIKSWGATHVDLRGMINGKGIEYQTAEELKALKQKLEELDLKVGVMQSSLCKVHLPEEGQRKKEMEKLEGLIRASEILDCRLVRSFNFWQREPGDAEFGQLGIRPDEMSKVLEMFTPFAKRAKEAGLILGFENCGQTADEVIALLDALNISGWGIAWDVWNYMDVIPEAKGDCVAYFTKALSYANMIHVKAASILPDVGGAKVPWDRVLRGVLATGKDMPVSIETHNPKDSPYNKVEATQKSFQLIQKVWPSAAPGSMEEALAVAKEFIRPYADNPVRFVVVGLGMGRFRARQLTETSGTKLMGVCDTNLALAKEVGEQLTVPYSDNINIFLENPGVEVMYVVTPTGLHGDVAEKCLMAGKHVLSTKPMDVSGENCQRMIALAKEKGLLLGVDFDIRHEKILYELQDAMRKNWFGRVLSANLELYVCRTQDYYNENGGWRGTWKYDGGGAMSNQGVHEIDRLLTVLGMPKRVKATIGTQTHRIEAEDVGTAVWDYGDGRIVRFYSTTSYPIPTWFTRIEIHGTEGAYIHTSGGPEGRHTYWGKDGKWTEEAPYPAERIWRQGSDNFANSVRTGAPLSISGEQGILSRILLDAMYQSARDGEDWVDIVL